MKKDPVLAGPIKVRLYDYDTRDSVLTVFGGLNYLKGNSIPYFSLTCWHHNGHGEGGGAAHELILQHFPQFADLAALHLSDINGVPMYASENGMYWLAGAMGNPFGEQYHGGNSTPGRSSAECMKIFREHLRLTPEQAAEVLGDIYSKTNAQHDNRRAYARALLAEFCETQKPRWKREADSCIVAHNLSIFGDLSSLDQTPFLVTGEHDAADVIEGGDGKVYAGSLVEAAQVRLKG